MPKGWIGVDRSGNETASYFQHEHSHHFRNENSRQPNNTDINLLLFKAIKASKPNTLLARPNHQLVYAEGYAKHLARKPNR